MKKNEQQLIMLEQLFQEKCSLSIQEIASALNIGRTSVYNYISRLEDKGYSFTEERVGHSLILTLQDEGAGLGDYAPITADAFRKYMIIRILKEQGPCDFLSLYRLIRDTEGHFGIFIKEVRLRALVKEMLDSGELEIIHSGMTGKTKLLHPVGTSIPLSVLFDSDDDMWELYMNLSSVSPGDPYYTELSSLRDKIILSSGDFPEDDYNSDNYIIYGAMNSTFSSCKKLLAPLEQVPYRSFALNISYKTRRKDTVSACIETGALIYSLDKDVLYLVGRLSDGSDSVIDVANIISVEATDIKNTVYHSAYYEKVIREMFSISTEEPVDVEIHFNKVFQVAAKVKEMAKHRPLSTITEAEDLIVYTDTVRGLNDLRNYLRQFGRACHVIKPESLRREMRESVVKALEVYQQEKY